MYQKFQGKTDHIDKSRSTGCTTAIISNTERMKRQNVIDIEDLMDLMILSPIKIGKQRRYKILNKRSKYVIGAFLSELNY